MTENEKKPRFVFAGNHAIALDALRALKEAQWKPGLLWLPARSRGTCNDGIKSVFPEVPAIEGIEFREPRQIERMRALAPDYLLSVHFPYLVPMDVLEIPSIGALNLHPAFLPYNRGWHTPSWAILEGTTYGATLHWMDEGVDTGDIAFRKELHVHQWETAHELYQRVLRLEADLFREMIPELIACKVPRMPQDEKRATSHQKKDLPSVQELLLDKKQTVRETLDHLRALTTSIPSEAAYVEDRDGRHRVRIQLDSFETVSEEGGDHRAQIRTARKRIYLSPPHMGNDELALVQEAFASNWIAPAGPHLEIFERELAELVGAPHALAVSSGTAAIHLALRLLKVRPGDEVLCSTLTFCATANPIAYEGGDPVFIDSDRSSWNMDPELLADELKNCAARGKLPRAVILVHLYGQSADFDPIYEMCSKYDVPIIEDAAEALGATYKGNAVGGLGKLGVFSFNGNKMITTSGGGMLVSHDADLIEEARHLATQARDPAPHYQHSSIGFNYRMSNVLAAIGRGQLRVLHDRVEARRKNFDDYAEALRDIPGIEFMPEAPYGECTRWLTCITINPESFGATREEVRLALEEQNIEARPVWKPLHSQPIFSAARVHGGSVAEHIFENGLCLPSGSNLTDEDKKKVINVVRSQRPHI